MRYFTERRPLKGFMKMYKTPPQRRRKKNDEEDDDEIQREELNHRHLAKDIHNNQVNSVSYSTTNSCFLYISCWEDPFPSSPSSSISNKLILPNHQLDKTMTNFTQGLFIFSISVSCHY